MLLTHKLYNLFHPKIGEIWCLHRVLPERSVFQSNRDLEITPDYLEQLIIERQRKGLRFVDLDTFVAAASGKQLGKSLAHVTFDDGFLDVFTYAYPILKQYQIPFTLYVTTDMPDGKADLWWIQMEQLANGNEEWFEKTTRQIYDRQGDIATTMHDITSSTPDLTLCHQLSLSWSRIREMVSDGWCTIGSHGISHSALTLMSEEQAFCELVESKRRLEEMLGVEVRHFSYPHSFFSETTNRLVWKAGYSTAVIGYGGMTRRRMKSRFYYRNNVVQS